MSDVWTPQELSRLEAELVEARDALTRRLGVHASAGAVCGDAADQAAVAIDADFGELAAHRDRVLLEQTEHVIVRLKDGTYDRCESCGGTIARERLQALPRATRCLACVRR